MKEKNYFIHPSYIIMVLILAGVSSLFFGFSMAYMYSRFQQNVIPIQLPNLFYFNTLILLASSFTLWKAKQYYKKDITKGYQISLVITLTLTLLFLVSQIFAWKQLLTTSVTLQSSTMASYLYLISFLHFAHVIAGIPFLCIFIYVAYNKMRNPVTVLIYFSDTSKKRKLDLLNIYWHFLDGLWIYLVLFFLINFLLK